MVGFTLQLPNLQFDNNLLTSQCRRVIARFSPTWPSRYAISMQGGTRDEMMRKIPGFRARQIFQDMVDEEVELSSDRFVDAKAESRSLRESSSKLSRHFDVVTWERDGACDMLGKAPSLT